MTLTGPDTRPAPGSREEAVLTALRTVGYPTRYVEDTAVYRILEPVGLDRPTAVVGLVLIRNRRIVYAEFLRRLYPYWGRTADSSEYLETIDRLEQDIHEGRRK